MNDIELDRIITQQLFYDIRFAKDKIILTNVCVTKYSIPDVDAFTIAFYGIC